MVVNKATVMCTTPAGWKSTYVDAFLPPQHPSLYPACLSLSKGSHQQLGPHLLMPCASHSGLSPGPRRSDSAGRSTQPLPVLCLPSSALSGLVSPCTAFLFPASGGVPLVLPSLNSHPPAGSASLSGGCPGHPHR